MTICKKLDSMGSFDIAIGGGEPTIHPDFITICKRIWNETNLGVSVTTHGRNLTKVMLDQLKGNLSFLRISIDGTWHTYEKYRNSNYEYILELLSEIETLIPFGINVVVNSDTINDLDEILSLSAKHNAVELLLLPQINNDQFILTDDLWLKLEKWILRNNDKLPLRLLSRAKEFIDVPYLFAGTSYENNYAYISTDLCLRNNSYTNLGVKINNISNLDEIIEKWHCKNILTIQ